MVITSMRLGCTTRTDLPPVSTVGMRIAGRVGMAGSTSHRVIQQFIAEHRHPSRPAPSADLPTEAGGESSAIPDRFRRFAHWASCIVGTPGAFLTALVVMLLWAASGPVFHFSDTWQLVINTGTTIVTFLMVFLIQTTQNRDASAIHLKLDELIRANRRARDDLVGLEHLTDAELNELELEFDHLRQRAAALRTSRRSETERRGR
jgi:low affinity Fe/Cu permease